MKKKALITGITGQDGSSYLAEFLINKGYEVHGLVRRSASFNTGRIDDTEEIILHYGDLSDSSSLFRILNQIVPDEIYNLAAQSDVKISFDMPEYTVNINSLGIVRLLEIIRMINPQIKIYHASTSEIFGKTKSLSQNEDTQFNPISPYGCSNVFAYWIMRNYRESYKMFTVNGILFNHESPRRGRNFVTRKITRNLCEIKLGKKETLYLGNLDAKRDWGYAKDYVESMWLMLQQDKPDDYVISTGETHSVREFVEVCANELGFDLEWDGKGLNEIGIDKQTGKKIIAINPKFFRPAEVDVLQGDSTKARNKLGWKPRVTFNELAKLMVKADLYEVENGCK